MDVYHVLFFVTTLLAGGGLFKSLSRNMELMEMIDEVDEALDEASDLLSMHASTIESRLKMEVFSDEPVIRLLVSDIKAAKQAVTRVSKVLDEHRSDKEENE